MTIVCKPIDSWPGGFTQPRAHSPFASLFSTTMEQLRRELRLLDAQQIVIEIDVVDSDLRLDGWPYATAKIPPPVKLSFESSRGPLAFATDRFNHWHDNIRAITLGLEALRKIDRYGITDRGDQYAGWRAIESASASTDDAIEMIATAASITVGDVRDDPKRAIRLAQAATHPDRGGSGEAFAQVQVAAGHLTGSAA